MSLIFDRKNPDCSVLVDEERATGKIFVLTEDGFAAVRKDGIWKEGLISSYELEEFFYPVRNAKRAELFFHEARTALSSKPNRDSKDSHAA